MITGSIVALITPMKKDNSVDYAALEHLISLQLAGRTDAIVILGTTGESPTLRHDEKKRIIKHAVKLVAKQCPVIVGAGTNCTATTIEQTKLAKKLGADACMTIVPYYNKPTQQGMVQHFTAIADAVDLPQILYNHRGRCVVDMLPETIALLARHPNIIGIKEGTADIERCRNLRVMCPHDFAILSGDDIACAEFMLAGGHGHISVAANLFPQAMHDLYQAATGGDTLKTKALNEKLTPLFEALRFESNPIPIKWAMHAMGLAGPSIRLPLTPLSTELQDRLLDIINQTSLL